MRRVVVTAGLALALSLAAGSATASGPEEAASKAQSSGEAAAQAKEGGKPSFVIMPIPQSNPALGNGLALAAVALYEPKGSGESGPPAGAVSTPTQRAGPPRSSRRRTFPRTNSASRPLADTAT